MKILFVFLTILSFMLLAMFLLVGDTYHAGLSAFATAIAAFLVTMYNE